MDGIEVVATWQGELHAWEHVAVGEMGRIWPSAAGEALDASRLPEDGSWGVAERGGLVVRARRAARPTYRDAAPPLDRGLVWALSGATLLGIAFLLGVGYAPPAASAVTLDALTGEHPLLAYVQAPEADEPVPRVVRPVDGSGPITDGPGRPMDEAAGVSGASDAARTRRGRIRFRGEREITRRIPRAADARSAGILGVLSSLDAAPGRGALAGAADVEGWTRDDAYGRPLAQLVGDGHGAGGFDMLGTGRGGCRPGDEDCGEGTVGLGPGLGFGGTGWGSTCSDTCEARLFARGLAGGLIGIDGRRDLGRDERRADRRASAVPAAIRRVVVRAGDGLTRQQIRRALRPHRDALRHCYAGAHAAEGGQSGDVEIGLAIDAGGRVRASEVVADTLGDGQVAACIADVARRVRFPDADAATVATVPFGLEVFGG